MSLQFAKPAVGSKVRITTRYKNHVLYNREPFVEFHYEGTVGSSHRFLDTNSFVLNTPTTPEFTRREISLSSVIDLVYLDGTHATLENNSDQSWTVKGSKGDVYTVTRTANKLNCSCVGFQFRKKCKHLEVATC